VTRTVRAASRAVPAPASRIHDVARAAGVSTATVSRALRGLDRVRPETRDRVLAAAAELSYVPSPHAVSLKSGKTAVIGVVVPFLTRWFFANLIDGADQVLRQHGYHLLVFNVGDHREQRTLVLDQQLLAKRLDGLLVLSADLDAAEVALLQTLRLPLVTVGLDLPGYDRVGIDDQAVGDLAMTHLLQLGHRRIGYIGGNPDEDVHIATAVNRMAGVQAALARAGVPAEDLCDMHGDWTVRGTIPVADRMLSGRRPPTAVLAASDEMAIGVLCAARARGIDVPGQLSVMGIDDHELAFTHDLTTVRQQVREQGQAAATMLLAAFSPRGPGPRRELVLSTELVRRGSTAPVARRTRR
jgi:LacI family repressor for deo operon, udp, cdd, tsx, nupC, and nupG